MRNFLFYTRSATRGTTPAFWSGYLLTFLIEETFRNKYISVEQYENICLGVASLGVFKLFCSVGPVNALLDTSLRSVSPALHQGIQTGSPRFFFGFLVASSLIITAIALSAEPPQHVGRTTPIVLLVAGLSIYMLAKTVKWVTKTDTQRNSDKTLPPYEDVERASSSATP